MFLKLIAIIFLEFIAVFGRNINSFIRQPFLSQMGGKEGEIKVLVHIEDIHLEAYIGSNIIRR